MDLILPRVANLLYSKNKNEIWQYFSPKTTLEDVQLESTNPFTIKKNEISYVLTSDKTHDSENEYVILTSRKPTKNDLLSGQVKLIRWLKHPEFKFQNPFEVRKSWKSNFNFIKENESEGIVGLRPPQLGALYSILGHIQNPIDNAIIVMPTGTGKTETMLATLIANECEKLLVSVPSDSLRNQISEKFITLGLLKEFNIVGEKCQFPIVGIIKSGFENIQDYSDFIEKSNVVISTMDILANENPNKINLLSENFSHFFIDEAHHSEARTWKNLIEKFRKEQVFLFTATPFRNDGKALKGKIIFNFTLKKAQEQKYYKEIQYLPIREYDKKVADIKIAEKAIEQLYSDKANGYNHIIMARCLNKVRAKEVYEYYKSHTDLNPIMVYTGISDLENKIESIKKGNHSIIVCVNMLGEGFDLPSLKIAAIHDERQSLPITLQFIGRFTRTSYNLLGKASFITNIAYPPISEELEQLYSKNSDWNLLLPRLSANATQKELDIQSFLSGFNNLDESLIPFHNIKPALSTVIFKNNTNTWNHSNWKKGISNIDSFEHQYSNCNGIDTLVIILGKIENVEWGNFETVQNLTWELIIVHWDLRIGINRVFINTSLKNLSSEKLLISIFESDNNSLISGMPVFRIFHEVKRLSLFNVGARKGIGQDITFQSYFGKGVQDGIKLLEQGTLIKNNIFGVGYKEGEKISIGCSVKGKIWSYQRGNLDDLTKWCKSIGELVENDSIDPNIVLQHTLSSEKISTTPDIMAIMVDWNPEIYEFADQRFQFKIEGFNYDLTDIELKVSDTRIDKKLVFELNTSDFKILFEYEIGFIEESESYYYKIIQKTNVSAIVDYGNKSQNLVDFFTSFSPTFWFADGSQLYQNFYVKTKERPSVIPNDNIFTDSWDGVKLQKESQDIAPYIQDSIQYYFINKIKEDFQIVYDDDGPGEMADIIGINNSERYIDIHLYHLKYAKGGLVNNEIENFYQVCGQAQKSINWKHRDGRVFFNHLFKRITKKLNGMTCSRLVKGSEDDIETLASQAKWEKEMRFHVYIVQPSLSKSNASNDILLLLGNTFHYLATVGNITLKVFSSI